MALASTRTRTRAEHRPSFLSCPLSLLSHVCKKKEKLQSKAPKTASLRSMLVSGVVGGADTRPPVHAVHSAGPASVTGCSPSPRHGADGEFHVVLMSFAVQAAAAVAAVHGHGWSNGRVRELRYVSLNGSEAAWVVLALPLACVDSVGALQRECGLQGFCLRGRCGQRRVKT